MLTEAYKRENIHLTSSFGVEYPSYFIHPVVEYQSLVKSAGVIDLTHWKTFRLSGKDRQSFLNAMVTNDVASLEDGRGCHSLITTIKGKIIAELFVFVREEDVLVFVPQGDAAEAYDVLAKHIISEDVTIEDLSKGFGVMAIEGPKAREILWRVFPKGPLPSGQFRGVMRQLKDLDVYVMGNSVTGEAGYHMMIPGERIERVRDYLVQASRGSDGLPVGGIVWNMRRVEKGLPWYGTDFTGDNFPDETRLGDAISYDKGCFRGQETLARLHHRGHVNRLLMGLATEDRDVPQGVRKLVSEFEDEINNYEESDLKGRAEPIARALDLTSIVAPDTELFATNDATDPSKAAGRVTSIAYSPQIKKPLLLGIVRRELAEAGLAVVAGKSLKLKPIELPIS